MCSPTKVAIDDLKTRVPYNETAINKSIRGLERETHGHRTRMRIIFFKINFLIDINYLWMTDGMSLRLCCVYERELYRAFPLLMLFPDYYDVDIFNEQNRRHRLELFLTERVFSHNIVIFFGKNIYWISQNDRYKQQCTKKRQKSIR